MRSVLLLADNDVLLSAAHWGLLDLVPGLVGATWEQMAVLDSFPHRVRRADPKLFRDPSVAADLSTRVDRCAALPEPSPDAIAVLQGQTGIDPGEAVLVAALLNQSGRNLVTGDKRALGALSALHAALGEDALTGRFLCTPQLLWHALSALGVDALVEHVRRYPDYDKATLAVFGRTGPRSKEDIEAGLRSYLADLDRAAPGLLVRAFGLDPPA
ncbi:MAG: hypothetical protein H4O13_18880 [Xanthomonadales bacterium]|nr:hypothetical protein [Xanthomonadales bacterium]